MHIDRGMHVQERAAQAHRVAVAVAVAAPSGRARDWNDPAYQSFALLRIAFTLAPVLFGIGKFFNVLTDWTHYPGPRQSRLVRRGVG